MKRNSAIFILSFFLLVSFGKIQAQVVDVCAGNDMVELHLGNYHYCFVQWQVSDDNEFWIDIEGAVDTVYRFFPKYSRYYRAKVRFPSCMEYNYYSQVSYVWLPLAPLPSVITNEHIEIAQHAAVVEGNVIDNGTAVTQRGVCWGTVHNPTVEDNFIANGTGTGPFSCLMDGLESNMTYYVRSYATSDAGTAYGNEVSFTTLSGSENDLPEGATNGLFSVDSEHQVLFSKGNLQYQTSANTWKFADHQWDFIGDGNNNASPAHNGWIDLFGWGTSGWHDDNDPINTNYYPWSVSLDTVSLTDNVYGYGPSINMQSPNLTGSSANYDWGWYNQVFNGGNQTNLWRTLTYEEWTFLLNFRPASTVNSVTDARFAKAVVNNVTGVVLFPDHYIHPNGVAQPVNINNYYVEFTSNNYGLSDWEAMEDAGAVFLPAAGERRGSYAFNFGTYGFYWTASCGDQLSANNLYFNESCFYPSAACYAIFARYLGFSVRLARFAKEVSTLNVSDITSTTAICSGSVVSYDDNTLSEHGICWGTSHNPTIDDNHVSVDGTGTFTVNVTGLIPATRYYFRVYATDEFGTFYGNEVAFFTLPGVGVIHESVDLGLPSGTLWASCNVGANLPEEYGAHFAWGETQPKDSYAWSNYQYCEGDYVLLTKYCSDPDYGYNGFTDTLITLLPEDDAATVNWGDEWCMPTIEQFEELYYNTTSTWIVQNGVGGRLFTASNGNSVFLPAAGYSHDNNSDLDGYFGNYWTGSLFTYEPSSAHGFFFNNEIVYSGCSWRLLGFSVRPVRSNVGTNGKRKTNRASNDM